MIRGCNFIHEIHGYTTDSSWLFIHSCWSVALQENKLRWKHCIMSSSTDGLHHVLFSSIFSSPAGQIRDTYVMNVKCVERLWPMLTVILFKYLFHWQSICASVPKTLSQWWFFPMGSLKQRLNIKIYIKQKLIIKQ